MNGDLFPETVVEVPAGASPSWFTPARWLLSLEHELLTEKLIPSTFDLDPFGHPDAPVSQLIARRRGGEVFDGAAGRNGLLRSWAGRVAFANPPYDAETLDLALPKMILELQRAHVVALLPAWTDRKWWHRPGLERMRRSGEADVRFVEGRLIFGWPGNPEATGAEGAKFASAVVIFRRGGLA